MSQGLRNRFQPSIIDVLERRQLMAGAVVAGNLGQILQSQFQPFGFQTILGTQFDKLRLGGPLQIDLTSSPTANSGSDTPVNTGLVDHTQFNGGGFRTVGLQFQRVGIGGSLAIFGSDNEDSGTRALAEGRSVPRFRTVANKGVLDHSQFNDGGFGVLDQAPDGTVIGREGRVGFQWRNTRVRGPVDIGLDVQVVNPGSPASRLTSAALPGTTTIDPTTNTGRIRDSQFNDGGFGDIGLQWSQVAVGRRVATSSNSLFIKPEQDNGAPITITNRTFGQRARLLTTTSASPPNQSALVRSAATLSASAIPSTETNAATNSGRIVGSQFNDGGFGDVGLQWKKVRVGGAVTAVHNSLTIQPENQGQGRITVQGVRFPAVPPTTPRTLSQPNRRLPTDPPAIISDGDPVTNLPTPTDTISPYFPTPVAGTGTVTLPYPGNFPLVNAATNSGLIRGGQFNAGGFGDDGLQWLNVGVKGSVKVVHNSLSVHPEGSKLAGVEVKDVAYGKPVSRQVARRLVTIPSLVISTGEGAGLGGTITTGATGRILTPPNDRSLTDQQLAATAGTDIFLQWNRIVHHRGLVVVHNILKITGVGPNTGPITLSNIRFPFRTPLGPLVTTSASSSGTIEAQAQTVDPILLNSADNSGYLNHAQFSVGGFGDDGLQWRNVQVGGSVEVVHNTLSVDASADLPAGDVSGPLSICGVTFNSGALRGDFSARNTQTIVSPPDFVQRKSSRPVNFGHALPQDPTVVNQATNSGIFKGGQLSAGGANHSLLQWQGVKVRGPVKVIDNILSISVLDRPSGPISISNVTFA